MNVGDRVALNIELLDDEGGAVRSGEVGMVIGHMGVFALVELDKGETYTGDRRMVMCMERSIRPVRVAHSGRKERGTPHR